MKLYFATHNPNKLREIQPLIPSRFELLGLDELGLTEDIPETSATIEGNSLQKTSYIFDRYKVPCFGDDTGLEVDALNGNPGVLSARYAGNQKDSKANMALLLKNLSKKNDRSARFKTVITYINSQGNINQFTGIAEGEITSDTSGTEGFGYDPIFKPNGFDITFAEMSMEEKNTISHRAKAFRQLVDFLNKEP